MIESKNLICIGCPLGCRLTASLEDGKVLSVVGQTCPHGEEYARKECTAPERTVTGTAAILGSRLPVIPVRTEHEVPKSKVMEVAAEMSRMTLQAPIAIGQTVCENICGTGVNLIATANAEKV